MWVGVPVFQARPLGKVHKSGHAILYALISASFFQYRSRSCARTRTSVFLMNKNDGLNFDFEMYRKDHEGAFTKAGNSIKKILLKILRFTETSVVVNIIAVIFAAIQVFNACSSSDTEVIIRERAAEYQKDAKETMQFLYSVTLPDSIENHTDIQEIRMLQDKLSAIELRNISLTSEMDFSSTNKISVDLQLYIDYMTQKGAVLKDWGEIVTFLMNRNATANPFLLNKCLHVQERNNEFNQKTISKLQSISSSSMTPELKARDAMEILKDYILSEPVSELNKMVHELNISYITWSNTQLLLKKVEIVGSNTEANQTFIK